jgi:two-component system cell cycle sensor histidine kinase/response regulator CckA
METGGEAEALVQWRTRATGERRWAVVKATAIPDAQGRLRHVVDIFHDMTARRSLEEQLHQSQKMEAIGRLAGGVAHDFNNLLTIITGYGELLLDQLPAGDPSRELVRGMVHAGDRAAALTRQLLAFSRKAIVEPRALNLKDVVADTDSLLRRVIGEDIDLVTLSDPEVGSVKADPGQITQLLLNLAVNARDAMPTGGRLTIEIRNVYVDSSYAQAHVEVRPGPYVLLAVSDTGCGIPPDVLPRIWEPFFTTKEVGKGTGLGLAVVHGVVKQAGGHIQVYSEPGRGATFKVYLPQVRERPSSGKSLPGLKVMPHGTETVLLVEDEEAVRRLARHVLAGCGYTVLEAGDGAEALRIAEQHPGQIDLLVTDVVMPRLGGRKLAGHLAGSHPGLKILFLSGYTDDAVVRHGILEAEVPFLQKPYSPAVLAQKVREVLDGR